MPPVRVGVSVSKRFWRDMGGGGGGIPAGVVGRERGGGRGAGAIKARATRSV